ncbi:MAG TPA: DUF2341 domain-containing protein, partial [Candidatus Paceibacterota bacterium]|nr:DUF2341 domain-containing protein [Candidatus Paceibacterota bacterium]
MMRLCVKMYRTVPRSGQFVFFFGVFLAAVLGMLWFHYAHADTAWYNSSWGYRVKITVDHTKVGSDLTNFPVYVNLSNMPASFWTHVKSNGGDIRITESDGVTEVSREVVAISASTKTGEVWFKAPALSSSTDYGFYIYYGNASASDYAYTDTYGRNAVWSDYLGVWHMNNITAVVDSTGGGNDIHFTSGLAAMTTSPYGDAVRLYPNGTKDISIATSTPISSNQNYTYSVTARHNASMTQYYGIADTRQGGSDSAGIKIMAQGTQTASVGVVSNSNAFCSFGSTVTWSTSAWANFTVSTTVGTGQQTAYMNGSSIGGAANCTRGTGNRGVGLLTGLSSSMDFSQVFVRAGLSSAAWISTHYKNESSASTFYSVGTEETAPVSPTAPTSTIMSSVHYRIFDSDISSAGLDSSTSTHYRLSDTLGQFSSGPSTSTSYNLHAGYRHMATSTASSS